MKKSPTKRMAKLGKLDIGKVFREDALRIMSARTLSQAIHGTNDIKASGNEVEEAVRKFLKDRMPSNFYVGHGHIIDSNRKTSPQFDILISDNTTLPILLRTNDSTEYFPSESIYALGEVKSTYRKSDNPLKKFCQGSKVVKDNMKRGVVFSEDGSKVLNAIYSFIIFVDSGDFKESDFVECYNEFGNKYLPNQIIFLDKGVTFYVNVLERFFEKYPEHSKDPSCSWLFSPLGVKGETEIAGNHLGFLYYNLLSHAQSSSLEKLNLAPYFNYLFVAGLSKIITLVK